MATADANNGNTPAAAPPASTDPPAPPATPGMSPWAIIGGVIVLIVIGVFIYRWAKKK